VIDRQFAVAQMLEEMMQDNTNDLQMLDRSILAKAFRGELVPQDPNDEPAAVLLERIRAEREQTSSNKQRGKTTRKHSSKQLSIDGIE
jgi:type I restriction enzyme, S subunit